jgi:hypothetical protein
MSGEKRCPECGLIKHLNLAWIKATSMKREEASLILEDVIDTLIRVGNWTVNEDLREAADKLLKFRDQWFKDIKSFCKGA